MSGFQDNVETHIGMCQIGNGRRTYPGATNTSLSRQAGVCPAATIVVLAKKMYWVLTRTKALRLIGFYTLTKLTARRITQSQTHCSVSQSGACSTASTLTITV